jgi:hypothetical protein
MPLLDVPAGVRSSFMLRSRVFVRAAINGSPPFSRADLSGVDRRAVSPAGIEMRLSDLTLILEGVDLASVRRRPRWRRA